jgi:type II secretory pathway predicted ATPase ExeA
MMAEASEVSGGSPFAEGPVAAPYRAAAHEPALADLAAALGHPRGYVLVTGEAGVGKSVLAARLAERLPPGATLAVVDDASVPFEAVVGRLREVFVGAGGPAGVRGLHRAVQERAEAGQASIAVLDAADRLDVEGLERLRALSFEMGTEHLLQLVLVGRPALADTLRRHELRQLRQRIGHRVVVPALPAEEVAGYVAARLAAAGAPADLFTPEAIARLAEQAGGIPRAINLLAERCWVIGRERGRARLDPDVVEEALQGPAADDETEGGQHWRLQFRSRLIELLSRPSAPRPGAPAEPPATAGDYDAALSPGLRRIIVIARDRARSLEAIRGLFASPGTEIVLDRRQAERRRRVAAEYEDRRRRERRANRTADADLRTVGYAQVWLRRDPAPPAEEPPPPA